MLNISSFYRWIAQLSKTMWLHAQIPLVTYIFKFITQSPVIAVRIQNQAVAVFKMLQNGFRVVQHRGFRISPVCVLHKRPSVNSIWVVNPFSPVCVIFHAWARVWVCQYVGVFVYVCSPCSAQLRYKSLFSWVCVQQGEALTPDKQHTDWKRCSTMSVMSSQPPHSPGTTNNHPVSTSFSPCWYLLMFSQLCTQNIFALKEEKEWSRYTVCQNIRSAHRWSE